MIAKGSLLQIKLDDGTKGAIKKANLNNGIGTYMAGAVIFVEFVGNEMGGNGSLNAMYKVKSNS